MFQRALVRPPTLNFAHGLTTSNLGPPDYARAIDQHQEYCQALQQCGLVLTRLNPNNQFPDATFVEDTAVLTPKGAILSRPGAPDRLGEVDLLKNVILTFFPSYETIEPPGTLDGGDVCEADGHYFIGISARTNVEGAMQLTRVLSGMGYSSELIDIRQVDKILHLKSGVAYLGNRHLAAIGALRGQEAFARFEIVDVPAGCEYAANCLNINDRVLVAAGFPAFEEKLKQLGYNTLSLQMSECEKMDGGLSCLSLRF
ncbi:MAG: dimethylarginine dimethylaminohydrolase family protein [Pyrinomonadaceae bacterium]